MIIGSNKKSVINNIKEAIEKGEYNKKVEVDDPNLSTEQKTEIIENYLKNKDSIKYKINNKVARTIASAVTWTQNRDTEIKDIENIKDIKTGAIITSNHFNPLDNTIVRKFTRKAGKKRLFVVGQETNLAMKGILGFLMNYADIIPISTQVSYMKKEFPQIIESILKKNNFILIYPEQEMWFNYRKPREPKPGAYYYAAKNNVPVISCFVEIIDKDEKDTDEFNKVKYVIHVLKPIYPDMKKTIKENTAEMLRRDYEQKKLAYEKAYNKKLDYKFEIEDIAGFINNEPKE